MKSVPSTVVKPTVFIVVLWAIALLTLSGCTIPQVKAEDRLFLDLSLDFLGEVRLPKLVVDQTPVGGLSGLDYDRQRDRFYAVSDDRSDRAPARFYTLKLTIGETDPPTLESVEVESVTPLTGADGRPFAKESVDLEGIALSPRRSVYIASEGVRRNGSPPFIQEFELETGRWLGQLPMPERFTTLADGQGLQNNRGFESLTLSAVNFTAGQAIEPYRVFTATESSLQQDKPLLEAATRVRFLHYLISDTLATLLAEHVYDLDIPPTGTKDFGLSDLHVLDQAGHFISLERSFGPSGFGARLFQIATGPATDTSTFVTVDGVDGITPIYKRLLLDLTDLGIALDNLEGLTLGPRLPDGSQSLVLISDDNFNPLQTTQVLLFRLRSAGDRSIPRR